MPEQREPPQPQQPQLSPAVIAALWRDYPQIASLFSQAAPSALSATFTGAANAVPGSYLGALESLQSPVAPFANAGEAAKAGALQPGGGSYFLPIAGALGAYDLFKNQRHGGRGALQGAASGAAIGSVAGPPGALIGAGIGGLTGYFGNFGDKDRFKTEQDRIAKLAKSGAGGYQQLAAQTPQLSKGRSTDELVAIENAKAQAGQYANPKFAASRNIADLGAKDIWGYAAFGERYPEWLSGLSEQSREQVANKALELGLVNEHHGTIDLAPSEELDKLVESLKGKGLPQNGGPRVPGASDRKSRRRNTAPQAEIPQEQITPVTPVSAGPSEEDLANAFASVYQQNQTPVANNPLLVNPYLR